MKKYFLGMVLVHGGWFLFSIFLDRPVFPSPLDVYPHLLSLAPDLVFSHFSASFWRVLFGLGASVLGGLLLGALMGQCPLANHILEPFVYFTSPIPKIALLPVVLLLLGLGEGATIFMIFLILVFPVAIQIRDGIRDIPQEAYHVFLCLGASPWQLLWHITLPAALAPILSSVRISIGTALSILFFTETYGLRLGLGFFIMDAWQRINYLDMFSGIVLISFLGCLFYFFLDILERCLLRWRAK